jgi:hypothetical protein
VWEEAAALRKILVSRSLKTQCGANLIGLNFETITLCGDCSRKCAVCGRGKLKYESSPKRRKLSRKILAAPPRSRGDQPASPARSDIANFGRVNYFRPLYLPYISPKMDKITKNPKCTKPEFSVLGRAKLGRQHGLKHHCEIF